MKTQSLSQYALNRILWLLDGVDDCEMPHQCRNALLKKELIDMDGQLTPKCFEVLNLADDNFVRAYRKLANIDFGDCYYEYGRGDPYTHIRFEDHDGIWIPIKINEFTIEQLVISGLFEITEITS